MRWFLITVAVLSFKTTTVISGITFVIQNTDDLKTPVTTTIRTTSDRNVSLTCKIVDSENKDHFENEAVWGKTGKGLWLKTQILGSTNLSFTPIKLRNRGKYFCASFKHGLFKIIYIMVKHLDRSDDPTKRKRWKRADVNSTTEIKRLFKENQNQPFEYNGNYKNKTFFGRRGFSYAGVIAVVIGVIIMVGASLYRLMKHLDLYTVSPERMPSEVEPACRHPTCGQYCTFAGGESGAQNPYHNVHTVDVNNASNSSTPTVRVMPSLVEMSNNQQGNPQINTEDLPPSYDNTVKNCDKHNLPPSYSEALRYMSVNRLPNIHSGTQGLSQTNAHHNT